MKSEDFCEMDKEDRRLALLEGSEAAIGVLQAAFPDCVVQVDVFDGGYALGIVLHVPSGME